MVQTVIKAELIIVHSFRTMRLLLTEKHAVVSADHESDWNAPV